MLNKKEFDEQFKQIYDMMDDDFKGWANADYFKNVKNNNS
jgi:hypothetical protein